MPRPSPRPWLLNQEVTHHENRRRMTTYAPTVSSLRGHPVPEWYEDAKFGIFIHWGLFSIPGFAPRLDHVSKAFTEHYPLGAVMTPYTEWYDNAIRVPESPSAAHHREHWQSRPYADFRSAFETGLEQWDPADWAALFERAGARYVVLVSKHHDGYCLWPSEVENPNREGWTTRRDLVGELAEAVRARGLRFGIYYSGGIDWSFNPKPVRTLAEFIGSMPTGRYPAYAEAQVRELIRRYEPSILWNDISWPTGELPMLRLMADYYAQVPEGVINDRWMHRDWKLKLLSHRPVQKFLDILIERKIAGEVARGEYEPGVIPPKPVHYDFRTPEYTSFTEIDPDKWEATRGMSPSFGYNRQDREADYEAKDALLHGFIDTVSKNGNLLLNVGPTGKDASIPTFQRERLEMMGGWLSRFGEAIHGTRPWHCAEAQTSHGLAIRFTRKQDTVYAIVLGRVQGGTLEIALPHDLPGPPDARLVGDEAPLEAALTGRQLRIELSARPTDESAFALRLCGPARSL